MMCATICQVIARCRYVGHLRIVMIVAGFEFTRITR